MNCLTLDLKTSAEVLGTEPEVFLDLVKRDNIKGIIYFKDQPKVSIFTLAKLLDTTPETLLEFIEDYALAQSIEEVEEDEFFDEEEGRKAYQEILAEVKS